jgi:hypothetical protein
MKQAPLLCAMVACAVQAFAASAAVPPERKGSPAAAADSATVARRADNVSATAGSAADRQSASGGSKHGRDTAGRDPAANVPRRTGSITTQRGGNQLARANSDRVRALLNAQARGHAARQPVRRTVAQVHAATAGGAVVRGASTPLSAHQAMLTASSATTLAPLSHRLLVGTPAGGAGGRHAPTAGLLGGSAVGRTAHNVAVDGTQMHHKL